MRITFGITWAAALVGLANSVAQSLAFAKPAENARAAAAAYYDSETGFTFSEYKVAYTLTSNVVVRIAAPSTATSGSAYPVVLQVVVPNGVGWGGIAWAGNMIKNPLTVAWANGNAAVLSSRWATSHSTPTMYTGATYEKLTTGNRVNGTHWQFTAVCNGCTSYAGSSGTIIVNPKGNNRLAFAFSASKPSSPSSNTSSIPVHDSPVYWNHDFSSGANANFADLVTRNGGHNNEFGNGTSL
ncbi:hypothetical protein BDV96DRAFT_604070 [Lophiotrema nucula]|uniref:Cellobiose dehydrogenase-like cytochrome domain-containing protein n=1 Tax=Lophiotrema nucula TaxID=690887 RepID=A0A6A5YU23_9PLEO|nr:hypothetical protein BDV96DRAFT_604070 [Lophiotrema nucula]